MNEPCCIKIEYLFVSILENSMILNRAAQNENKEILINKLSVNVIMLYEFNIV